jgi:hypothetical protein
MPAMSPRLARPAAIATAAAWAFLREQGVFTRRSTR